MFLEGILNILFVLQVLAANTHISSNRWEQKFSFQTKSREELSADFQARLQGDRCSPKLKTQERTHHISHEYFSIICDEIPIFDSYLNKHFIDNVLENLQIKTPEKFVRLNVFKEKKFSPMSLKLLASGEAQKIWYPTPEGLTAALYVHLNGSETAYIYAWNGGDLLKEIKKSFSLEAYAYERNSSSPLISLTNLNIQKSTSYLASSNFRMLNPDTQTWDNSVNQSYNVIPSDGTLLSEQMQVLSGAEKIHDYYKTKLGVNNIPGPVQISIRETKKISTNNAAYMPGTGQNAGSIYIGAGDNFVLTGLGYDNDVVSHEFSHHIIYRRITNLAGESLILHEGFADFFTYSYYNNPNLGETIVVGRPYLRTALIGSDKNFATDRSTGEAHRLGSYWSALLWRIRAQLGEDVERIAISSLNFMREDADLKNAFVALLEASDAMPLSLDKNDFRCTMTREAVDLGFTEYLIGLNLNDCGVDLNAAYYKQYPQQESSKGGYLQQRIPGCASVTSATPLDGLNTFFAFLVWIFSFLILKRRRYGTI